MSPFASRTVVEHFARGACAILLVVAALWLLKLPDLLRGAGALCSIVAAVVLLRGCPMCWLIGLVETVSAGDRKGQHS